MTQYSVVITPEAEADLENLWGYIAHELEVPESAYKIVDDLYAAIATLDAMPKRLPTAAELQSALDGIVVHLTKLFRLYNKSDRIAPVT